MNGKRFSLLFLVIATVNFVVPFYLIGDIPRFYGSYLFWSLLTLVVIGFGSIYIEKTWGGS